MPAPPAGEPGKIPAHATISRPGKNIQHSRLEPQASGPQASCQWRSTHWSFVFLICKFPYAAPFEMVENKVRRFRSLCLSLAMTASSRFFSASVNTLAYFILKTSSNHAIY